MLILRSLVVLLYNIILKNTPPLPLNLIKLLYIESIIRWYTEEDCRRISRALLWGGLE